MKKSSHISAEDSALFRETVGEIKPLKQDHIVHNKSKPSTTTVRKAEDDTPSMHGLYDSEDEQNQLGIGDELFFARPGVQKQTIRKLRRGQLKNEDELDLHGLTVEMARKELSSFLKYCTDHSLRCVRIIHGKGIGSQSKQPVIKNRVNNWLRQRKEVLAFCSAQNSDGGTGAIYLLLKKNH